MKKVVAIIAVAALVVTTASSCKTHENCPAYGKSATKSYKRHA